MNIHPFIFNWVGQYQSALRIETKLNKVFEDVTVVNSDDNHKCSHWHNIGDESFFTAQWFKCLELYDSSKVLFHVQADTQYDHWDQLVSDASYYMNKYNAGIYYPRVTNVEWSEDSTTEIKGFDIKDSNIKFIANGDETVWFIHPKIIKYFMDHNLKSHFINNRIGWGWDIVFCGISHILGMPVIRDSNHIIEHKKSRGYQNKEALIQLNNLINSLPFELRWYARTSRIDQRRIFLKKYLSEYISSKYYSSSPT